jgi:hypothetical protein
MHLQQGDSLKGEYGLPTLEDHHLHFSGALPLSFLWSCYEASREDVDVRGCIAARFVGGQTELHSIGELRQLLDDAWSADWRANLTSFFATYATVQQFTKASRTADGLRFYFHATTEIVRSQLRNGVFGGEIICGPSLDNKVTNDRLLGMCSALQEIKGHSFGLRLTFIRGADGRFRNLSTGVLENLRVVLRDPAVLGYVRGFDFSGEEHPHLIDETLDSIHAIDELRSALSSPDWNISVHVGEDLRTGVDLHIQSIEKLLLSPITRISHGTFLWLPASLMQISESQQQAREKLLRKLADGKISLEVCPSANLKLSPLVSATEIPVHLFNNLGLQWSIITDNPTLFGTTLQKEHKLISGAA